MWELRTIFRVRYKNTASNKLTTGQNVLSSTQSAEKAESKTKAIITDCKKV